VRACVRACVRVLLVHYREHTYWETACAWGCVLCGNVDGCDYSTTQRKCSMIPKPTPIPVYVTPTPVYVTPIPVYVTHVSLSSHSDNNVVCMRCSTVQQNLFSSELINIYYNLGIRVDIALTSHPVVLCLCHDRAGLQVVGDMDTFFMQPYLYNIYFLFYIPMYQSVAASPAVETIHCVCV